MCRMGYGRALGQIERTCAMRCAALVVLGVVGSFSAVASGWQPNPVRATGSVELKNPAGNMGPITTSSGEEPPLDVVLLAIKSDGTRLSFAATMKDPLGKFAATPVTILIE